MAPRVKQPNTTLATHQTTALAQVRASVSDVAQNKVTLTVVSGALLVAAAVFPTVASWCALSLICYIGWAVLRKPDAVSEHTSSAPPSRSGPPVVWYDLPPNDDETRSALRALLPDMGVALFTIAAPLGQDQCIPATEEVLRALARQRCHSRMAPLIAFAPEMRFAVAMIPLSHPDIVLAQLPAAPAQILMDTNEGPWLLVALGMLRPGHTARMTPSSFSLMPASKPVSTRPAEPVTAPIPVLAEQSGVPAIASSSNTPTFLDFDLLGALLTTAPSTPASHEAVQAAQETAEVSPSLDALPNQDGEEVSDIGQLRPLSQSAALPPGPHGPITQRATSYTQGAIITLGRERQTDAHITIPLRGFGGLMAVAFGVPRQGKTTSLEGLVQQTGLAGMPWIVPYDTKPEWHGLRYGEGALPFIVFGDTAIADVELSVRQLAPQLIDGLDTAEEKRDRLAMLAETLRVWQHTVRWVMENRQSAIYDLSSPRIGTEGQSRVLTALLLAIAQQAAERRLPFGVLIDEAQNVLPEGKVSKQLWNAAMQLVRTSPSHGATVLLAAHRPTDVAKSFIAPARLRILHRVDLQLDIEAYSQMLPWTPKIVRETVETLKPGEAIVYGPGLLSRNGDAVPFGEPVVVRMQPATTYHVGYTPTLEDAPPTLPMRLALDTALLEQIRSLSGVVIPSLSRPLRKAASNAPMHVAPAIEHETATTDMPHLTADQWPEAVRARIRPLLQKSVIRLLVRGMTDLGYRLPIQGPLSPAARQEIVRDERVVPLIVAVVDQGVSQKDVVRVLYGISDSGRANQEISLAIAAYRTANGEQEPADDENHYVRVTTA